MTSATRSLAGLLIGVLTAALFAAPALAAPVPAPAWSIQSVAVPTHFVPGDASADDLYELTLTNTGGAPTDRTPITITDTLPAGLVVEDVELLLRKEGDANPVDLGATACDVEIDGDVQTVTCEISEGLPPATEPALVWPSEQLRMVIHIETPASVDGQLVNLVAVEGGDAEPVSTQGQNAASAADPPAGLQLYRAELTGPDGLPTTGAGTHPYQYTTVFAVNTVPAPPTSIAPFVPAGGDLKDIDVALPPGLVGNPNSIERCTPQQFNTNHVVSPSEGFNLIQNECPDGSAVGLVAVQQLEGTGGFVPAPLYNLVPPPGMPAQLGFQVLGAPFYIDTSVRTGSDYGIAAHVRNTSEAKRVTAASVTVWGTPADKSHDRLRGHCDAGFSLGDCPSGLPEEKPFMRLPTSCASPLLTTMSFDSWTRPGGFVSASFGEPAPVDCGLLDFSPTIEALPSTSLADSPSGLRVNLHIPQKAHEDPQGRAEADLRDATVTLPAGLTVNPASADGLGACTSAQIGLTTPLGQLPPRFTKAPAQCPNAAKVATAEAITPLLDNPIKGSVFLAKQGDNPFRSLLAIYLALDDPETGIVLKLAGHVKPDPKTGQLTTTFTDNPQLPFEDLTTVFFDGPRAPLHTPSTCGTKSTNAEFTPWSAADPDNPLPSEIANTEDSFEITTASGGGTCPTTKEQRPFDVTSSAGSEIAKAGAHSAFSLRLTKPDGNQEFRRVELTTPPGFAATLKGVTTCSDAAVNAAESRDGKEEMNAPSCPSSSLVGSTTVGAGVGPTPVYVKTGKVYLTGPYKGAPLSLAFIVPAVAGPFDLGVQVVRTALFVDSKTAQVTAKSDPIPTILEGVPLAIKDIRVNIDRSNFTLNPTNCEVLSIKGTAFGEYNSSASLDQRFQVGECSKLKFHPKLDLKLSGGTKRADYQRLRAVVTAKPGEANIGRAAVTLPHSIFLANEHIRTVCTRVQFAAFNCPKGSVYGKAEAITPLLDEPLKGHVYLRSSSNPLPDLVARLRGPDSRPIEVELSGRTDSVNEGIRNTFDLVPDAPVSKFTLELFGGEKSLLVNSRDLCKGPKQYATARFVGQNGKRSDQFPQVRNDCGKKKRGKRVKGKAQHGRISVAWLSNAF